MSLSDYTRIEYLQSSGTQFITTDIVPTAATRAELKLVPIITSESAIMGSSWAINGFFLMFYSNKIRWHSGGAVDSDTVQAGTEYTIEVTNTSLKVNGVTYSVAAGTPIANAIRIFSTQGVSPSQPSGQFQLFYAKFWEDDALIGDFVPVRNANNVGGLYDQVSDAFFTNSGTGTFTLGPDVPEPPSGGGFKLFLQQNLSENNRIGKNIIDKYTLTGTLKQPTSIIDPVILIQGDPTKIFECNYLTIPIFNRKYFIRQITVIRSQLVELQCHVDVLESFKAEIRDNYAIIHKQQNATNLYLNDGTFRITQKPDIFTVPFPSGFSTQEFVLAVAGAPSGGP